MQADEIVQFWMHTWKQKTRFSTKP